MILILKHWQKNYKIISNLPYNISVPFILKMIKIRGKIIPWKEMILMVQKEVAERITAKYKYKKLWTIIYNGKLK